MAVLAGLEAIDFVVPFSEDTPERVIEVLAPDVLVKGGDYRVEQIAGHKSVLERGGEVRILDFFAGHSTTGLIERLQD
jgi:D-beta-D-heptose 7-phosphate kinase/D-beta-D-heptose 1-phosphate adenosyltransferase